MDITGIKVDNTNQILPPEDQPPPKVGDKFAGSHPHAYKRVLRRESINVRCDVGGAFLSIQVDVSRDNPLGAAFDNFVRELRHEVKLHLQKAVEEG